MAGERGVREGRGEDGDWLPRPDPTLLTTQQLLREMASLKELVFTRLDAMDKAVTLLAEIPTETDKQIGRLKELVGEQLSGLKNVVDERFGGVEKQFKERDTRVDQTSRDSKLAIDAALQAAKEAVGKSETSTIKQIDAQGARVDDLKDRIGTLEGRGMGSAESKTSQQMSLGLIIAFATLLVTALGAVLYAVLKP